METKDFSNEPDVVAQVQLEIEKLGENTKVNYTQLRRAHESLKKLVDEKGTSMDAETKSQITKLTEDITTRQNAIDTQTTKRIDNIETALRRPGFEIPGGNEGPSMTEAKELQISCMIAKGRGDEGVRYDELKAADVNFAACQEYKGAFENLLRKGKEVITPENVKALQVGIDPFGGYTVTPQMSSNIIKRLFELDPIRQLAGNETVTTGALEWLVDWGDADSGWEGETEKGPETDTPEWKKKRIAVHTAYAKPKATQTIIEDSGINIENWLSDKVSNRISRVEGIAFVNGGGINTPRGFLTYPNGTNFGQVEQIPMLHATNITADGFIKVKYSLIEQYLNRGTWLMNRLTVAEAMYLKTGTGEYIWKPGLAEDRTSTILSLPVRMSTTMPLSGVPGKLPVALADWKEAYMIVDRLGITVQRDPFTLKPFVEFYTRKRVGGDLANFQGIKLGRMSVA